MIDPDIVANYDGYDEETRLDRGAGRIELLRTQEILRRYLPSPPARVLDVGGGPGAHARWLVADGYEVVLVDAVDKHVAQAAAAGIDARLGDARRLDAADESADVVLLLGPLYHLIERADRLTALQQASRVVRPGGLVAVAAINRFASLLDGFARGFIANAEFRAGVERDIAEGQHRNPERRPGWFTTAYFHRADELRDEVTESGLALDGVFGVEGPAGWFEGSGDDERIDVALWAAGQVECEPDLAGLSAHLLAVAHRRAV